MEKKKFIRPQLRILNFNCMSHLAGQSVQTFETTQSYMKSRDADDRFDWDAEDDDAVNIWK